ncbi:probable CCR4-associated factor 1 homolog 11 [Gossypium hirsutum]|uniref:poly(A)-specific ribonuclease n=1 Tax=Gossypium hirsutum TaxID=3635 RepID=A0A1U8LX99_GOSHI|nr:probable CCR4-associated factor 1 homolog 11 [Gossypium hirsutum]PPD73612.1 hypothetical protein GOBAR_DD29467 [Gossypium barbadense]
MSIFGNKSIVVRRVFAEDSDSELLMIKEAILTYPFLSIDIEFPGTIFKPSKQVIREGNPVINYHYMKSNVDVLQIIQLGLSLSDAQGNLLDFDFPFSYIWEFNFRDFNINRDHYASDSIELFKHQGIDFEKNKEKGIDSKDFAKKFWDYGLHFRPQTYLQVFGAARQFRENSSNIKRSLYYRIKSSSRVGQSIHTSMFYEVQE